MTVLELINELLHLPPEHDVIIDTYDGGRLGFVFSDNEYAYVSPE